MESKHQSEKMLKIQLTAYFNKAFYEQLCCDSEAVSYVLRFTENNGKDNIQSLIYF